jgi:hypothetical protein
MWLSEWPTLLPGITLCKILTFLAVGTFSPRAPSYWKKFRETPDPPPPFNFMPPKGKDERSGRRFLNKD